MDLGAALERRAQLVREGAGAEDVASEYLLRRQRGEALTVITRIVEVQALAGSREAAVSLLVVLCSPEPHLRATTTRVVTRLGAAARARYSTRRGRDCPRGGDRANLVQAIHRETLALEARLLALRGALRCLFCRGGVGSFRQETSASAVTYRELRRRSDYCETCDRTIGGDLGEVRVEACFGSRGGRWFEFGRPD